MSHHSTPRRCFLLLIDGLRADVAERELAAGNLPHLAALTERGARARAVTTFPSTTSVSYLPFLTGCLPGACNIPSIRWIDRAAYGGRWMAERRAVRSYCGYQAGWLDDDIDPTTTTLFQRYPDSAAIFSMITRGLDGRRNIGAGARQFWGTVSHFTEWHQPSDDAVARALRKVVEEPYRFVFAQFPAVDGYTHALGPDAPRVMRALQRVDATIGDVVTRLASRGELDDTLVLVVSDHGSAPVHRHLDLAEWFTARGVRTLAHPVLWRRKPGVGVMVAGNGAAGIYARPGERRRERLPLARLREPSAFGTPHDVVAGLVAEDAVALVAAEDGGGGIAIVSRAGEASVCVHGDHVTYSPLRGDPLHVGGAATRDAQHWLESTIDGPFPDAVMALLDQFASPRAGDLVVAASEGWDFRERWEFPEHHAGHGSLVASHMLTPAWSNRPLPARALRTRDLHDVIVAWLDGTADPGPPAGRPAVS